MTAKCLLLQFAPKLTWKYFHVKVSDFEIGRMLGGLMPSNVPWLCFPDIIVSASREFIGLSFPVPKAGLSEVSRLLNAGAASPFSLNRQVSEVERRPYEKAGFDCKPKMPMLELVWLPDPPDEIVPAQLDGVSWYFGKTGTVVALAIEECAEICQGHNVVLPMALPFPRWEPNRLRE